MARIRTIKPDFWSNEDLANIDSDAKLLAIALLNFSDDEGYFKAHSALLKSFAFPFQDNSESVPRLVEQLVEIGYISIFTCKESGKRFGRVNNFSKHQRVDKPKPSEIKHLCTIEDDSKINQGSVYEGREGKGKEGKGIKDNSQPEQSSSQRKNPSTPYKKILELYANHLNGNDDHNLVEVMELTPKRKSKMNTLWLKIGRDITKLDNYFRWIYEARDGHTWLFGENDRGWKADIEYVCRIETFAKAKEGRLGNWGQAA